MIITTDRKRKKEKGRWLLENRYKFRKKEFQKALSFRHFVAVDGPYCMSKTSSIMASIQPRVREMGYAW